MFPYVVSAGLQTKKSQGLLVCQTTGDWILKVAYYIKGSKINLLLMKYSYTQKYPQAAQAFLNAAMHYKHIIGIVVSAFLIKRPVFISACCLRTI